MSVAAEQHLLPLFAAPRRMVPQSPMVEARSPVAGAGEDSSRIIHALRPYQLDAVAAIGEKLGDHRSTLLVMATGLGKTQVFGEVARGWPKPGRVLVIAHRDELITQARDRLQAMCGEYVDVEKAEQRANGARIVVASIQTLANPTRHERFRPDAFELVVVDEAHHAVAGTYKRVLEYFEHAKVLGVTATPDRADEKAMGQVFDSVAYVREIEDGIKDGYLCPIRVRQVQVEAINLAAVRTTAGDLNQGDLDTVMAVEEAIHGVAKPTIELAGDRRTIVFTTSVETAHRMAEVFNRYRGGCARAVDGGTATDLRRAILKGHKNGDYQFLVNVGVLTEGYDDPGVSCVAMARPTKSRALYAQCAGRGLRILQGKADCLLLDFVGNSGRHRLVSALDILAGKYTDEELEAAKAIAEEQPGIDAQEALEKARAEIEEKARKEAERAAARRANVKAKAVKYSTKEVNPFGVFGVKDPAQDPWADRYSVPATEAQLGTLAKFGMDPPKNCSRAQASKLIGVAIDRKQRKLCSYKQLRQLQRRGIDAQKMPFETARSLMDAIAANGWRDLPPAQVQDIIGRGREVGAEG